MDKIERILNFSNQFERVYIYGAGEFGRAVCLLLDEQDFRVGGFIISCHQADKKVVLGHAVYSNKVIGSLDKENDGIIVAVNNNYSTIIQNIIINEGFTNILVVDEYESIKDIYSKLKYNIEYTQKNDIAIFLYHRVGDIGLDTRRLSLSINDFVNQLEYLSSRYNIISSEEDWSNTDGKKAIITFDDGYYDFHDIVLPILEEKRIPATVFVTTDYIDSADELWGDKLERIVFETLEKHISFYGQEYFLYNDAEKSKSLFELREKLKNTTSSMRISMMSELENTTHVKCPPRTSHRLMNSYEVIRCSKSPYITIGSHTESHCCLAYEDIDKQRHELLESKIKLESITGAEISTFAYPYGTSTDFTDDTISIAKEVGYKRIFSACPGMTNCAYCNGRIPRNNVSTYNTIEDTIAAINRIDRIYGDEYV